MIRIALLAIMVCIASAACETASIDDSPERVPAFLRQMAVVDAIKQVLHEHQEVGRIYYRGHSCRKEGTDAVEFPDARTTVPTVGSTALGSIRSMLRGQDAAVTQDGNVVRVRFGQVPDNLLKLRIRALALDGPMTIEGEGKGW